MIRFRMGFESLIVAFLAAATVVHAQYPPPVTHLYELVSPLNPDISIKFKTPDYTICNTTNPSQRQYSGYIHLPPNTLAPVQQDYNINTFFWFIEARENPQTAPLTIWLNGGPGSSSMIGLLQEVGPCQVVQEDATHLKTIPREFGWDRSSNMLFIDQPNQVGFSYDTATNGVLPLLDLNNRFIPNVSAPADGGGHREVNITDPASIKNAMEFTNLLNGTFSSGNKQHTANTTEIAAQATYHFLQAWVTNFPQYYPTTAGLQLVAESYGGKYGPTFSAYMEKQNALLKAGKLPNGIKELHLESLGIVNGCIDDLIQAPYYPIYGNQNPYSIKAISDNARAKALEHYFAPGGCKEQIEECRRLQYQDDPNDYGDSAAVNLACKKARSFCDRNLMTPFFRSGRGVYDIAHADPDPFPPSFYLEYLNNATVQQAIGTPVNFTQSSSYVYRAFDDTGDMVKGGEIEAISYLLDRGVRVAMIYGDRDFICNYMGGQAVSLSVNYTNAENFRAAGYEDVHVNSTYVGGQVRQYGNFSFTRVYQAGHLVPVYQPQTAWTIFSRLINGRSIATGEVINTTGNNTYSSKGPRFSNTGLIPPTHPPPVCFVRSISSCTKDQFVMLAEGKGVILNGVLYNSTDEYDGPGGPPMEVNLPEGKQADGEAEVKEGQSDEEKSDEDEPESEAEAPDNVDPVKQFRGKEDVFPAEDTGGEGKDSEDNEAEYR